MSHFDEMYCIYGRTSRDCCKQFPCVADTPPLPPEEGYRHESIAALTAERDQLVRDLETARECIQADHRRRVELLAQHQAALAEARREARREMKERAARLAASAARLAASLGANKLAAAIRALPDVEVK